MEESTDILLAKWLSGEITEGEKTDLMKVHDLAYLQAILAKQDQYEPSTNGQEEMWNEIQNKRKAFEQNRIQNNKSPQSQAQLRSQSQSQTQSQARRKINWLHLLIILLGLLTAVYFFSKSNSTVVETRTKMKTRHLFADGSTTILGPQSKISYDKNEWEERREVKLTGQAFFQVQAGVPFVVQTAAGRVEVVGTAFDVWSIDDSVLRVICTEGTVRVYDDSDEFRTITAGQSVRIRDGKVRDVKQKDNFQEDWREGFRIYKGLPFALVLIDLERFYDVSFTVSSDVPTTDFTGVLPINNLDECLLYLERTLSLQANKNGKSINFSAGE